jgi:hypothetical protein
MYPDLDRGAELVHNGEVLRAVEEALGAPYDRKHPHTPSIQQVAPARF